MNRLLRTRIVPTFRAVASARVARAAVAFSSLLFGLRTEVAMAKGLYLPGEHDPDLRDEDEVDPNHLFVIPPRSRGELFFVDAAVADPEAFWLAAPPGATVVCIPADVDSWNFMARESAKFRGLAAIHIVSHGRPGAVVLNGRAYSAADLESHSLALRQLGRSLTRNGDILLYGCEVGAGREGRALVDTLAAATGADIAASRDLTGSRARGGNWELEVVAGEVDRTEVLRASDLSDYDFVLHTANVSTVAQLKAAISTGATDGAADTITITGPITFASAADAIAINVTDGQTMSIVGGGFTLSGGNYTRVLDVQGGSVAIDNLTITNGKLSGTGGSGDTGGTGAAGGSSLGAGVRNAGILTISNSTITGNKSAGGGGGGGSTTGLYGGGGGGAGGFGNGTGAAGGLGAGGQAPGAVSGIFGGSGGGAGGRGGSGGRSTGGAGSSYSGTGYSTGGAGATASNGSISIGGGGGGTGVNRPGGAGGDAAGGFYNAPTGTLTIINSSITNNIAAGGGGGGGGSQNYASTGNGGVGGIGIGGIWNKGGIVRLDSTTNLTLITGNIGTGGAGGLASGGTNTNGANGTATSTLTTTNGGSQNTNYAPAPTVTSVSSSSSNRAYKAGEVVSVDVTFSAAVNVTGTPQLTLETGTIDRVANYSGGGGSNTLTFTYNVLAGDSSFDLDYQSVGALGLNGGTIKDATANNAVLSLPTPGAANSLGANKAIVIDGVAPTAMALSAAFSTDSGSSASDFITNSAVQTISGSLNSNMVAGEIVEVSLDNGSTWTTATSSVGANTWVLSGQILVGSNSLRVRVTDAAGNTGPVFSQAYVFDTTAPTTTVATLALSADTGVSSTDFITKSAAQTISGTTSANLVAGEFVEVSLDNGATWSIASSSVGANAWSLAGQTLTGSDTLKARVTDTAGNSGTPWSQAYVLDTTAPIIGTPDLVNASDSGVSSSDNLTSRTTPNFTGAAEAASAVNLYDTDGVTVLGAATANGQGKWTITSSSLAEGSHTLKARATDTAGNTSLLSSGLTVTIDTTPPGIVNDAPTLDPNTDTGRSNADGITNIYGPCFNGTGADVNAWVNLYDGGALMGTTLSDGSGNYSYSATFLSEGVHQITAKNVDNAGNIGPASSALTMTVDATTPTTTIQTVAFSADTGASSTDFVTRVAAQTISGTTSALLASDEIVEVSLDNGATWMEANASAGASNFSLSGVTLSGSDTMKVRVTDIAGNANTALSQAYILDTTAPTTTISSIAFSADNGVSSTDFITNIAAQTISGTTSNGVSPLEAVEVSLDNGASWTRATTAPLGNAWSLTGQTLTTSSTMKVRVVDLAGNAGTTFSRAYLLDTDGPAISSVDVPASGTYGLGQNLDFTVNLGESIFIDTTGGTPSLAVTLDTGGTVRAAYVSGSGTSALVFRYTVASGDSDATGVVLGGSIIANGGTLRDTAGNDATLTLNSVGSTAGVLVDTVAPVVQFSTRSNPALATTSATSVVYRVSFSESVSGVDVSDFSLVTTATASGTIASVTPISGSTYDVTVGNVSAEGTLRLDLKSSGTGIADLVGTPIAGGFSAGEVYTIIPANTAPVADAQSVSTNEDAAKTITLTGSDPESDALTFTIVAAPQHGTLSG
ncbi:MAG: Ig-like domain-containing protein, partial [Chthoniobacteraceae bacterium]